jgi:hypothetical protein
LQDAFSQEGDYREAAINSSIAWTDRVIHDLPILPSLLNQYQYPVEYNASKPFHLDD